MPTDAEGLAKSYIAHLRYTDATRRRAEALYADSRLYRKDVELIYAGLYLDAVTGFERFIEELFIGILSGKIKHRRKIVVPRVGFNSSAALWDVVVGPRYADWLPYDRTETRANAFFTGGLPFTLLEPGDKKELDAIIAIRHVLAHKSDHSLKSFEKKVLNGKMLTAKERSPAGFLRSVYMSSPAATRYEEALNVLKKIALKLV